jgi:hypothetical protein
MHMATPQNTKPPSSRTVEVMKPVEINPATKYRMNATYIVAGLIRVSEK